ncbi:unnamed protein product [Thelazia callipaeda]|uniref:Helicase C-terminal domain-containing protein n=1 Tax=Thelazia callipaeda TaxID=103827 RepID=A0A0N5CPQ5_THECL|nr:unnamed protein product [Thelazia callipaeda]
MEHHLRTEALKSIDKNLHEVQVVVIVLTRGLAQKVTEQLNSDAGKLVCLPCINDRRFEVQIDEMNEGNYHIVAGTLGRVDVLFYRNGLKPLFIKELYILDSIAMVNFPLKRSLERVLGFIQKHIHITLHLPPSLPIVNQIRDFTGNVACYSINANLIAANHFALQVTDEARKVDVLCNLCQMTTSVPILICCKMEGTAFLNAQILRSRNMPVITLTGSLSPDELQNAIDTFQSCHVNIMIATGYVRGLIDLNMPMVIINYDLPKPDAYARRVNFTRETWIAKNTVFITLIKLNERNKIRKLRKDLELRWILEMYSH